MAWEDFRSVLSKDDIEKRKEDARENGAILYFDFIESTADPLCIYACSTGAAVYDGDGLRKMIDKVGGSLSEGNVVITLMSFDVFADEVSSEMSSYALRALQDAGVEVSL